MGGVAERKRVPSLSLSDLCRQSPWPLETHSIQPPPLAIKVYGCHPPDFCHRSELRAAARMGPPECCERRAKPAREGGTVGCGGWEGSGWVDQVHPGFGVRTWGRLGREALGTQVPGICWDAVPRAALRVAALVESSPSYKSGSLWSDAESRMLSCPETPQSLE